MKSKVTTLLKTLRAYAIEKGLRLAIDFHQEDSYFNALREFCYFT